MIFEALIIIIRFESHLFDWKIVACGFLSVKISSKSNEKAFEIKIIKILTDKSKIWTFANVHSLP